MPVVPQATPNPNALKFIVGVDVGGPKTFVSAGVASGEVEDPAARALLEIDGVTSVFMTAQFVTLSKTPDVDWADITPTAQQILSDRYDVPEG